MDSSPLRALFSWAAYALLWPSALAAQPLNVSGFHPSLATFNEGDRGGCGGDGGENGIGAAVPWAGRLWFLTYSPHCLTGSSDKLYTLDADLKMEIRPESVGGTPAGRHVHQESGQLFIGPYVIDSAGKVRTIPPASMRGRITAWARHLGDPANRMYAVMMEGAIWEVDVRTLAPRLLFGKPVPGWHGKGAYTGQNRLVVSNNGELAAADGYDYDDLLAGGPPANTEEKGVLAEWNGTSWRIVERRQFVEVTGPGGIQGSPDATSPIWSTGWDKRSVLLKVLEDGQWHTWRLPKGSHTYDHTGGWYTEWPRIREVAPGRFLMNMHGLFYDFPRGFRRADAGGLKPLSTHLIYTADFTGWNGKVILAPDITTVLQNPMAGRSQSNLWFGSLDGLKSFGPRNGWGGPWMDDPVAANAPSLPYLAEGFDHRVVHFAHDAAVPVTFTVEIDPDGKGSWAELKRQSVPASGYAYYILPKGTQAAWIRFRADRACRATTFLHTHSAGHDPAVHASLFRSLAAPSEAAATDAGLIRPAAHNKNLQYVAWKAGTGGSIAKTYWEVDERLVFSRAASRQAEVENIAAITPGITVDAASVIVTEGTRRWRLPKGDPGFDRPGALGPYRNRREVVSERALLNAHGTFYELGRESGMASIKPIATHNKAIQDFCSWRGLLVLSGTRAGAPGDGQHFRSGDGSTGLWFGGVDDLWKLGRPVGTGGPWLDTPVQANAPSDPYLMTGYERKILTLSHQGMGTLQVTVEVDFDHQGWHPYGVFPVAAGAPFVHEFPEGYSAHWVRFRADRAVTATAQLLYTGYGGTVAINRPTGSAREAALRAAVSLSGAADRLALRPAAASLAQAGEAAALRSGSAPADAPGSHSAAAEPSPALSEAVPADTAVFDLLRAAADTAFLELDLEGWRIDSLVLDGESLAGSSACTFRSGRLRLEASVLPPGRHVLRVLGWKVTEAP